MKESKYNPNMTLTLLEYMYSHGIYTIQDVMEYVKRGKITKDEFHSITRLYYDGIMNSLEKKEE